MKSAGKARNNGLYRHIRTSKEIIRNLLNDLDKVSYKKFIVPLHAFLLLTSNSEIKPIFILEAFLSTR
jgi:hypothetical protein